MRLGKVGRQEVEHPWKESSNIALLNGVFFTRIHAF